MRRAHRGELAYQLAGLDIPQQHPPAVISGDYARAVRGKCDVIHVDLGALQWLADRRQCLRIPQPNGAIR